MRTIHDRRRMQGWRRPRWPRRPGRRPVAGGAGLLLAAGLLTGSAAVAAAGPAAATAAPVSQSFTSFGTYQVTVPQYTTSMDLTGLGAAGLSGQASADGSSSGGAAGSGTSVTETLPIGADYHAGDVLLITVGREGGGGAGGTGDGIAGDGGSGGGASLVFDQNTGVYLMVAGGGGGGGGGSGLALDLNGGSGGTDGAGRHGVSGSTGGAEGDHCASGPLGIGGQGDSAGTASGSGGGGGGGGGTCAGHGGQSALDSGGGGGGSGNSTTDPGATDPSSAPGTNTGDGSVTVTFTQNLQAPTLTPPGCQYALDFADGFYGRVSATGVPAPTLALVNAPAWITLGDEQTTWDGSTFHTSAFLVNSSTVSAVPGEYTFTVEAFNSQGSTLDPITVVAEPGIGQPAFLSAPAATATAGMPFSFQATEVGCPGQPTYAISFADPSTGSWLSIDRATGLLTGTPSAADIGTHTFTITASPSAGSGEVSQQFSLRVSATSPTPPTAPAIVELVPFDRMVAVTFTPPVDDGGAPVTSYTVTATDHTTPANGGQTATVAASRPNTSAFVSGLTNGDHYTFTVTAANAAGTGDASAPSVDVTPFTFPSVPSISSVTPGSGQATVDFDPPAAPDGGVPIASYTVTATDHTTQANGGQTAAGTASPITVTGLTNGDSYTFTVTAINSVTSETSIPSDPVTPFGVPGTPAVFLVTPGTGQATVNFTPPADNGGSPVTGYTVTATDQTTPANGGQTATGTTSPITVTGLTNGDSYAFTVTATNAAGSGGPSPATPASTAVPIPPGKPSADLSVTLSPHPSAADGATFTDTVTVANHGPWPAASVLTGITIPAGLTLIAYPGGIRNGPVVTWSVQSVGVNASVTYTITVKVNAKARGTVLIAAASASLKVPDPRPLNNAAVTTVKLG